VNLQRIHSNSSYYLLSDYPVLEIVVLSCLNFILLQKVDLVLLQCPYCRGTVTEAERNYYLSQLTQLALAELNLDHSLPDSRIH
jgi:tRNA G10  N-methylase Trm11